MKKLLFFALIISFATSCSSSKQTTAGTAPAAPNEVAAKQVSQPVQPAPPATRQPAAKTEIRYTH